MGHEVPNACPRCRNDCTPLSGISADDVTGDFICVGANLPSSRKIPQDRFTLCWKTAVIDERGHWDKRDLMDNMSVIAQALSNDENIRINSGFTEDDMQQVNFLP